MKIITLSALLCSITISYAQQYSGIVKDQSTNLPIENATVYLLETDQETHTANDGTFTINVSTTETQTLQIEKDNYVFESLRNLIPNNNLSISLRPKIKSTATARWENYLENCNNYNNPNIPNNPNWDMSWTQQNLTGVFAPSTASQFTRRDPTAVIKHNDKFYVWYTRKVSQASPHPWFSNPNLDGNINVFPWDNADVWYATSSDGINWDEKGPAVERGNRGQYDDQSVFTPEIFTHNDKFYLVYQAVQWPYIERVKNTVGMAVANSPDGPWTKLDEPILRPTDNGKWSSGSTSRLAVDKKGDFDSHKVHDPCLIFFNNKFYLYYKGERMGEERYCGEREIRWGLAIADNPTGPYIKSEYNPITTSGHEVAVWNYDGGVAIIQKLDGPERGSIQFASDGVNFEMMGSVSDVPDALGLYRPSEEGNTPRHGATWGLAHKYDWSLQGGANYLVRFDIVPTVTAIEPPSNNALIIEAESYTNTGNENGYAPGGYNGANKTNTGVNFINNTDWMDFSVTISTSGNYELFYNISTPSDNAAVQFIVNTTLLADTSVPNNGAWDEYSLLKHSRSIYLEEGNHTIRIRASGTNSWQWNLDKVYLDLVSDLSSPNIPKTDSTIVLFPNPVKDYLQIKNLTSALNYSIYDLKGILIQQGAYSEGSSIDVSKLPKGAYIFQTDQANSKLFVKE